MGRPVSGAGLRFASAGHGDAPDCDENPQLSTLELEYELARVLAGEQPLERGWRSACCVLLFGWRLEMVRGSEAAVEVVVDHADVLHERVHARRPDEAVAL
jgi:hypothetical protein